MQLQEYKPHVPQGSDLAKGALAGAVAGLAAGFVMERAMKWMQRRQRHEGAHTEKTTPQGEDPKVAIVEKAGVEVPEERAKLVAGLVHYGMSGVSGAIYGAAAEVTPLATILWGVPFGLAVWAAAPATTLPALGLAPPPSEVPAKAHATSLAMHALFGAATETVRRPLRAAMG
ncbi:MAG: hypothetical protein QOE90_1292 [Thermoplasmata archaeon]|jgi:uncharacterized membrane protein YagU involved in acid resistance|nr:hypothetical protein [Thermoplasmata archaeon]